MRGRKNVLILAVMLAVCGLGLTGCGKKAAKSVPEPPPDSGLMSEPLDSSGDMGILEGRTSGPMVPIYFAFDSSAVDAEQASRMETNAQFLRGNPNVTIRVEGNCDPRGTQEYNLALGERRAQSGKRYLAGLGVDPSRMTTISFGEEKLLLFGHDELSWAQNRRDDFVITGR